MPTNIPNKHPIGNVRAIDGQAFCSARTNSVENQHLPNQHCPHLWSASSGLEETHRPAHPACRFAGTWRWTWDGPEMDKQSNNDWWNRGIMALDLGDRRNDIPTGKTHWGRDSENTCCGQRTSSEAQDSQPRKMDAWAADGTMLAGYNPKLKLASSVS